MGHEECKECERSFEELYEEKLTLDSDGFCSECGPKLAKEWEEEMKALERDWRRERL